MNGWMDRCCGISGGLIVWMDAGCRNFNGVIKGRIDGWIEESLDEWMVG